MGGTDPQLKGIPVYNFAINIKLFWHTFTCIKLIRWDLAEWLECLTANDEIATVLGSNPTSSDRVESKGRQIKQCWIPYSNKKIQTNLSFMKLLQLSWYLSTNAQLREILQAPTKWIPVAISSDLQRLNPIGLPNKTVSKHTEAYTFLRETHFEYRQAEWGKVSIDN